MYDLFFATCNQASLILYFGAVDGTLDGALDGSHAAAFCGSYRSADGHAGAFSASKAHARRAHRGAHGFGSIWRWHSGAYAVPDGHRWQPFCCTGLSADGSPHVYRGSVCRARAKADGLSHGYSVSESAAFACAERLSYWVGCT